MRFSSSTFTERPWHGIGATLENPPKQPTLMDLTATLAKEAKAKGMTDEQFAVVLQAMLIGRSSR